MNSCETRNNLLPDLTLPVVMSIINVTADSFYPGSRCPGQEEVRRAVVDAVTQGAGILDVGGYSSRPGADDVPQAEELRRVSLAVEVIRELYPHIPVSVDTFRSAVVRGVVEKYGPCIVNDISAGELDPQMIPTVASLDLPYIAMHMRSNPSDMQDHTSYVDIVGEIYEYFIQKTMRLCEAGINEIIIDPGFGFAKTTRQNYILLEGLHRLAALGYPVLSGVSRKSMIYKVLGVEPSEAMTGTTALNWESLRQGASIIRVHDTRAACDVVELYKFYKSCVDGE